MIPKLFKPKSVDTIIARFDTVIASFDKLIEDLSSTAEHHDAEVQHHAGQAVLHSSLGGFAAEEAARARRISERIQLPTV